MEQLALSNNYFKNGLKAQLGLLNITKNIIIEVDSWNS